MKVGDLVRHKDGTSGFIKYIYGDVITVENNPPIPIMSVNGHQVGYKSKKPIYKTFICNIKNVIKK